MAFVKKHKNDLILIAALLLLAAAVWGYLLLTRQAGGEAVVAVDGEETMRLPLSEDAEIRIGDGEHYNILIIKNGEAHISEASCPDHVCMRQGTISYDGEMIVCLPNKLTVTVTGGERSGTDAISQ